MTPLRIAEGSAQGLFWRISVEAKEGAVRLAHTLLVEAGNAAGALAITAKATISPKWEIPDSFVEGDHFGVENLLSEARREFIRRYGTIELAWDSSAQGFFGIKRALDGAVSAEMRGCLRLNLEQLLTGTLTGDIIGELELRGLVNAQINGIADLAASTAVVVVIRSAALPGLRIDLDDFNFSLPECRLPSLDLSIPNVLDFDAAIGPAISRALAKLLDGISVAVTPAAARLQFQVVDGRIAWAVVKPADSTPQDLVVTISRTTQAGVTDLLQLTNLTLEYENHALKIDGQASPVLPPIEPKDGGLPLGPLRLDWKNVAVQVTFVAPVSVAESKYRPVVGVRVTFDKLILSAVDDPRAVIGLKGAVVLTPSGSWVEELSLVDPYPLELLVKGLAEAAHLAAGVVRILASLKPDVNMAPLLETLGRIAAAIARGAVFVGQAIGDALVAIARAVAGVVDAAAHAIADAGNYVDIEIRFTVDPFQIRQVIVTARGTQPAHATPVLAAGFQVDLQAGWRPAVVLDFVAQPGAYFVALMEQPGNTIASLSTDLWLTRDKGTAAETTSPMRDADPKSGERGARPLLSLKAESSLGAPPQAVVLVGVARGNPVFFQKLVAPPRLVDITVDGPARRVAVFTEDFSFSELTIGGPTSTTTELKVTADVANERVLSLLGMGETGEKPASPPPGTGFLDKLKNAIGQVVWIEDYEAGCEDRKVKLTLSLGAKVGGITAHPKLIVELSLDDFRAKIVGDQSLVLDGSRVEESALGLLWIVEPGGDDNKKLFQLSFDGPETSFSLYRHPIDSSKNARMEVRYAEVSSDGAGLIFDVTEFRAGRGGVNLTAVVRNQPVRLNGLDVPFRFTTGRIVIRNTALVEAAVAGSGKLPPELAGDAGASIALVLGQENGAITLQSGTAAIDKAGEPIKAHLTRFTLTISHLGLNMVRDGGIHFYFLVTGTLQFTPKPGEFESGLLQNFKDVRIKLDKVPLARDPRVLLKHIEFQVALSPKQKFNLFNLFSFELRGIGFHPASPKFDGNPPAMNVSGQIAFSEIGDVMQPKIDFHGLWIAPPKSGNALPRLRADGLGVQIGLAGTAKLSGTVLAVDGKMPTLEGERIPPQYKAYGFLGEGQVDLTGLATLSASFGFLEVEHNGDMRKSFFLFLEQNKVAYEVPTPIWVLYLREVGFGFGYRYTLNGIKQAESAKSTAELIKALDDASKTQGDLARFSAWRPDPEKDNVTLALRGALQVAPAAKTWDDTAEKKSENPFIFDLVAALRSDMTFLMSVRGWLSVNYWNFFENTEGLRSRPMFRGYLYISAPRAELLARFIADPEGYIGDNPPLSEVVKRALKSVQWSATLYIRPGLFHYELGWPDQLRVKLFDEPDFNVQVRGGFIFRIWDLAFLYGYNIEANAFIRIGGSAGGGSLGLSAHAELSVAYIARFLASVDFRGGGVFLYGLISLDARLALRVSAWLHLEFRFFSIHIDISFSLEIQISAAVEMAISEKGVGARGRAAVSISVFGARLGVAIGFEVGEKQLELARARVNRFLSMSLTAEAPEPLRESAAQVGDTAAISSAAQAESAEAKPTITPKPTEAPTKIWNSALGVTIEATDFWLVLRKAGGMPQELTGVGLNIPFVYATLVPQDGGFYAGGNKWSAFKDVFHKLSGFNPGFYRLGEDRRFALVGASDSLQCNSVTDSQIPATDGKSIRLRTLLNECFLYDADTATGEITKWAEPARRVSRPPEFPKGQEESSVLRDRAQRDFQALVAKEGPEVEGVRGARSTLLLKFLDEFVTLADTGRVPNLDESAHDKRVAHIADFGLVFLVRETEIGLLKNLQVEKSDAPAKKGKVTLFNPRETWFDRSDPVLDATSTAVKPDGIKLNWTLRLEGVQSQDHESYLHHYEVIRVMQGREFERRAFRVKPVETPGRIEKTHDGLEELVHHPPDWQFTDDLADLPPDERRALLPMNGPDEAVAASLAWADRFPGQAEITVTYLVTPVDTAGARALPRAFVVNLKRPAPPVRPAVAKLVVAVSELPKTLPANALVRPAKDLELTLGLSDPHWKGAAGTTWDVEPRPIAGGKVERRYRLVLHQDDIVPSGSYGSDGLTDRQRGPGQNDTLVPTADEITFELTRQQLGDGILLPGGAVTIPDDDRKQFPHWFRVLNLKNIKSTKTVDAGKVIELLDALWRRPKTATSDKFAPRVAVRVFLETVIIVTPTGAQPLEPLVARRTPVVIELRTPERQTIPETFEWPVRIDYLPLVPGRVRARAGLTFFKVPPPRGTLAALLKTREAQDPPQIVAVRDPDRTVLTQIEWDAMAMHENSLQTIGGYDLHELDLDDLPPSLTDDQPFHKNSAWTRARKVARVQLLRPSMAMFTPAAVEDPAAWHAHYPSETWRTSRDQDKVSKGSLPIRKAWHSPRESTLKWPEFLTTRRAVLATADDAVVSALFVGGNPQRLKVELDGPGLSVGTATIAISGASGIESLEIGKAFELVNGSIQKKMGALPKEFTPSEVRQALLALKAEQGVSVGTLTITGQRDFTYKSIEWVTDHWVTKDATKSGSTGDAKVTIEPSVCHPVLAQVLDLLIYDVADGTLYRRYTVLADSGTPFQAVDLGDFCVATAAAKDPYGWTALRALGLAVGIRIYDGNTSAFLSPEAVLKRVQIVFDALLEEYKGKRLGLPFADVMLRPGRDRLPGDFDAFQVPQLDKANLDDEALSFVQIALRPQPIEPLFYSRLELKWKKRPKGTLVDGVRKPITKLALEVSLPDNAERLSVLRPYDRRSGEVGKPNPQDTTAKPQKAVFEISLTESNGPWLTLLFRDRWKLPNDDTWKNFVKLTGDFSTATGDEPELERIVDPVGDPVKVNGDPVSDQDLDLYEQFAQLAPVNSSTVDQNSWDWTGIFVTDTNAAQSLRDFGQWAKRMLGGRGDTNNAKEFVLPASFEKPQFDPKDLTFLTLYIPWSQRFLDHTSLPGAPAGASFSLSAPIRQQPWKLAAGDEGQVTINFVHQDSLAHARAYAVRPIGRYHEFAVAAPENARAELEDLVLNPIEDIGYGVAVAERTARLETPVILGTQQLNDKDGKPAKDWQLVVARHPEQDLIMSNRALFARLGFGGVQLSFVRDYENTWWPKRFSASGPAYDIEPRKLEPPQPHDIDVASEITPDAIAAVNRQYPSLWKGADIYNFTRLPHHLRITVLAAASAGAVVSSLATATQRGLHYVFPEKLEKRNTCSTGGVASQESIAPPRWGLKEVDNHICLEVQFHLLSYADLMELDTFAAWAVDGKDVAYWPDHEVVYILLRATPTKGFEEEEAEIQKIPEPEQPGPQLAPYMLRARGPNFEPLDGTALNCIPNEGGPTPYFRIQARLQWKKDLPVLPRSASVNCTPEEAKQFDTAIKDFGHMSALPNFEIALPGNPGDPVIEAEVRALLARLGEIVAAISGAADTDVRKTLNDRVVQLTALLPPANPTPAEIAAARIPLKPHFLWPNVNVPASGDGITVKIERWFVNLDKVPTDDQMNVAKHTGLTNLFRALRGLVREVVLQGAESFAIRAVKGQVRAERTFDGPEWNKE